jgi:hypothetical protein
LAVAATHAGPNLFLGHLHVKFWNFDSTKGVEGL